MNTLTIITHLFALALGAAGGGYFGYKYGARIAADVQAIQNAAPPK